MRHRSPSAACGQRLVVRDAVDADTVVEEVGKSQEFAVRGDVKPGALIAPHDSVQNLARGGIDGQH